MKLTLFFPKDIKIKKNETLFCLLEKSIFFNPYCILKEKSTSILKAGIFLKLKNTNIFQNLAFNYLPSENNKSQMSYLFEAQSNQNFKKGNLTFEVVQNGFSLAIITLSDKGALGKRQDESAPIIQKMVEKNLKVGLTKYFLIPDDKFLLRALLSHLSFNDGFDLIITTGGTGVSPRDITPIATSSIIDKRLYGFEQAMMISALKKTKHAPISSAVVGIAKESLIINLPGSPKAVSENLESILPAIEHTILKAQGDKTDCALSIDNGKLIMKSII